MGTQGKRFGRPDTERLGLFSEMLYLDGKGYVSPFLKPKLLKGKNMYGAGHKIKDGTTAAYVDKDFKRIFVGEGIPHRPMKSKRGPVFVNPLHFMPVSNDKIHSTPGDYYGCFSGVIEHFSNQRRPVPPYKRPFKNCLTRPTKLGGPGYADIGIDKYPDHIDNRQKKPGRAKLVKPMGKPMLTVHFPQPCLDKNPYADDTGKLGPTYVRPKEPFRKFIGGTFMPTGPCKWQAGCHGGTINKFPEGMPDKYVSKEDANKRKKGVPVKYFAPQSMALKSMYTASILNHNTDIGVNQRTIDMYKPSYTKYLLN